MKNIFLMFLLLSLNLTAGEQWAHGTINIDKPSDFGQLNFTLSGKSQVSLNMTLPNIITYNEQEKTYSEGIYYVWILESTERRLIWHSAYDLPGAKGTIEKIINYEQKIELPAGSFELYLTGAEYVRPGKPGHPRKQKDQVAKVSIKGSPSALNFTEHSTFYNKLVKNALLSINRAGNRADQIRLLSVPKPTTIRLYAIGEGMRRAGNMVDFAWIENLTRKTKIWSMDIRQASHAGGSRKNLMIRQELTLEPGEYAIHFVSDESHSFGDWTEMPPTDPTFWGITLWAIDKAPTGVSVETYQAMKPIVDLTKIGNDENREVGLILGKPIGIRIVCLGEGTDNSGLTDFGWIENAITGKVVWEMNLRNTTHAGGDPKNRMANELLKLQAGNYTVHYSSDDSHAFGNWNAMPPLRAEAWGIRIYPVTETDMGMTKALHRKESHQNIIASIRQPGNDSYQEVPFFLKKKTKIKIVAIGEMIGRAAGDYGWIENNVTGQKVWKMTLEQTQHAGGANKNRIVNTTLVLPAGEYTLVFATDDTHCYNAWNSDPPSNPEDYGITLYNLDEL